MRLTTALSIGLVLSLTSLAFAGEENSKQQQNTEVKKHNAYLKKAYLTSYSQQFCYAHYDSLTPAYEQCVKQIMHPKQ